VNTKVQAPRAEAGRVDTDGESREDRSARLALAVFVLVAIAVLPIVLLLARRYWFFWDEWDFLAGRDASRPGDLLRPHNEHWSTLPILVYRALWRLFGLRTYVPYQAVSVALHVTVAVLLRVVMRRAGVGPWIATAAASLFALFGAGDQNIVWPFQMAWTAALVFGITQLLLADHDGPLDRRDWIALLAGFLGLLCSGVAVTMTIVVGLAMLIRRGWRIALFQTAPLGAVYAAWWLVYARNDYKARAGSVGLVLRFVANGLWGTFDALGQLPGVGIALIVLLGVGLTLAWRPLGRDELRRRAAAPAALLAGPVVFLVITAFGRASAFGASAGRSSRYLYIVAALSVPAVAVAADAVGRRWRIFAPAVLAVLVVGIPGNIKLFADHSNGGFANFQLGSKRLILSVGQVPVSREVPRSEQIDPVFAEDLTVGWILDGVASGRVPDPGPIDPVDAATTSLALALRQSPFGRAKEPCQTLGSPVTRRLEKSESIGIDGGTLAVVYLPDAGDASRPRRFNGANGPRLVAKAGPLMLRISPVSGSKPVKLCA
jgi:hypothetical protein